MARSYAPTGLTPLFLRSYPILPVVIIAKQDWFRAIIAGGRRTTNRHGVAGPQIGLCRHLGKDEGVADPLGFIVDKDYKRGLTGHDDHFFVLMGIECGTPRKMQSIYLSAGQ